MDTFGSQVRMSADWSEGVDLQILLLQCWEEEAVPQDMRDAKIIALTRRIGSEATATTTTVSISITNLVKQECILAPTLPFKMSKF